MNFKVFQWWKVDDGPSDQVSSKKCKVPSHIPSHEQIFSSQNSGNQIDEKYANILLCPPAKITLAHGLEFQCPIGLLNGQKIFGNMEAEEWWLQCSIEVSK